MSNLLGTLTALLGIGLWSVLSVDAQSPSGAMGDESLRVLDERAALDDYLAYAALNNPGLKAAFNRWKADLEKVAQAESLPNPQFTFAYFIEEVETRAGPQQFKLGLSQKFPWFGKLGLQGAVADASAKASFEEYESARRQLFYQVKQAYYEYYYLHRMIAITADNVELLKHLESVARLKYKAGASQSGVITAQVELGKLDDRLRSLHALRVPLAARFNAVLNRPRAAPVPWPQQVALKGDRLNERELHDLLVQHNPELKALDHRIHRQDRAVSLARKGYYPNLMLGVDYIDTEEALMPGTPDSGKDPVMAMVAVEIPLWRGSYKAAEKEARHRQEEVLRRKENRTNHLQADLEMALYRFKDGERKIDLYGNTLVPQSEQSLKVTEEAYRVGTVAFISLIDAERLLLEFQLAHERALVDREVALAEIEKLVGRPLSGATVPGGAMP